MNKARIGFIGLGNMGLGMARNLVERHVVKGFDMSPKQRTSASEAGIEVCGSVGEVAKDLDFLFTMLPGPREITQVMLAGGVAAALPAQALWIDMSSSSHAAMKSVLAFSERRVWSAIDAPVTGGVPGALAGTLQVFVGGHAADFARAKPILDCVGNPERIIHVGDLGAGYAVKLCINLSFFLNAIAGAEVMALGVKAGVNWRTLHSAICGSGASTKFLEHDFIENFVLSDYKEYFRLALATKDIRLANELGRSLNIPMKVSEIVEDLHLRALDLYGDGGQLLGAKLLVDEAGVKFD